MLTADRKRRRNPVRTQPAIEAYGRKLRKIAEHVGTVINGFPPGIPSSAPTIEQLLNAYADLLRDWATNTASAMLMDVALRDEKSWMTHAKDLSVGLRKEIRNAPTGQVMRQLLSEQVVLIQSIPREAALRVHQLTLEGIADSTRASEIAREIMRSGEVAKSRALTIARTEVSRTAATLTQARAQSIGSDSYIWRTSGDSDVRSDHRALNGKVFQWSNPPIADERSGARAHPGCIYNCRCYAEPILPF
ncbi:phage head morphogenesis protein [Robbsia andropogonis]|uniref:phage head morphogenesis protein n=1 Tax=Robbsia andropogonis TaxID=28092 RepID=UPI00209E82A1|nr:phage minor head protein [Robbsia andropogonis]MCP1120101.1 phage minor head protein [Robbsia andropogonis]MCP1130067.1 phage minor head protein [Robbsia andropogonis]